ncbi:MAG: peptide deformylase [Clostridia bacterium]|nr:peptide deformylase [Clostridia bacterium]
MAIRKVREEGDEILRKKSKEVEIIDDKIRDILNDMVETLHKYNGVGLAGPQVGMLKRIIVIDLYEEGTQIYKLVNPRIVKTKGSVELEEGCLSFPDQYAKIIRPEEVEVEAQDENGKKVRIVGKGLLAQALAHEIDHLDGILFVDKIIPGTLEKVTPEE